jgi:hypothetical protein
MKRFTIFGAGLLAFLTAAASAGAQTSTVNRYGNGG